MFNLSIFASVQLNIKCRSFVGRKMVAIGNRWLQLLWVQETTTAYSWEE